MVVILSLSSNAPHAECRRAPNEEARSIPNWHQLAVFYCTIANLNTVQLVVSTLSRNFPSGISLRSDIGSDPR